MSRRFLRPCLRYFQAMPERPDERYSWLYEDDRPRTVAPQATAPPDLPPPNLPPPSGKGGARPPRKPRRRRPVRRVIVTLFLAWLLFLVAVPLWAWSTISRVDAEPDGTRPGDQPGTTYLLVGSDSRRGLSAEEQKELATGGDDGGRGRTDTIMLMHVGSGPTVLLSLPRDSLVEVPGYGVTKINAAYAYGGAPLLVETIEKATGIRVDDYVEIGFGGLVKVVDSVGGIEICPEKAIKDPDAGLDIGAGCQRADGKTALGYSRSRHTYVTQDIQRVQSQREVLGQIAAEAKSPWTVLNPVRYARTASGAAGSLQIGENVGPVSMARFAWKLSSAMSGDGLNCTVPLRDFRVTWDPDRSAQLFELIKADRTADIGDLCTPDGLPKQ